MYVVPRHHCEIWHAPGFTHQTLASIRQDICTMETWRQTLAPGHALPWHCHACEKIIKVQSGRGVCRTRHRVIPFGPESTVVIESGESHQLASLGDTPLEWIATLSMTPVVIQNIHGQSLPMPWETPRSAIEYTRAVQLFTAAADSGRLRPMRNRLIKRAIGTADTAPHAMRVTAA